MRIGRLQPAQRAVRDGADDEMHAVDEEVEYETVKKSKQLIDGIANAILNERRAAVAQVRNTVSVRPRCSRESQASGTGDMPVWY